MEKKCRIDETAPSLTAEKKTNIQNQKESEASVISSEVSNGYHSKTAPDPHMPPRTSSLCSKESSDVVQLSSADSIDQKPCQFLNENTSEKKSHIRQDAYTYPAQSDESLNVEEPDSSHISTKSDPSADNPRSKNLRKFDLNEDMEANGIEFPEKPIHVGVSEPISVVAKVGVPVGLPEKPPQFGGELGCRRSAATSAFHPTSSKSSNAKNGDCGSRQSLASLGIDLNIAVTTDSEAHTDETSVNVNSEKPQSLFLDLNSHGTSGFDFNDGIHQIGSGSQSMADTRRPSYWVDLSSMSGFHQVQSHPFLALQPEISFLPQGASRLHVEKIQSLSPTIYPPGMLPHLNNHQYHSAALVPHLSGSVFAAYPGAPHVLDRRQVLYPAAYASIRPTLVPASSVEFLVPPRNALFERAALPASSAKRREPDGGWDYSQANYRAMASWN